jgi:branched-chain amino acid transport system permease protein
MELIKEALWSSKFAKIQTAGIIIALVVVALVPQFTSAYVPLFLAYTMSYCIMAVSWAFFSGKTGYISLATGAFYGIGMYTQALLGRDLPLVVTMVVGAAASFGLAYGIGVVTLRLRGVYFTIFTFGLALFLNKIVHWYETAFLHTKGHMVKGLPGGNQMLLLYTLIVFAIVLFAVILLNKSRFGQALVCIGQNEDSAQHVGVNTTFTKVMAFAISAAPVGAVGAVMSTKAGFIDPDMSFSMTACFFPVLMAIFGGMQSLYGPVIGAVVFWALQNYLLIHLPTQNMIVFGAIMIAVVLLLPKGLVGVIETIAAKRRRGFDGEVIGDV